MASVLCEVDRAVANDKLRHTEDETVDFRVLEHNVVLGPVRLLMGDCNFTLIRDE